jgi:hypothetical protein
MQFGYFDESIHDTAGFIVGAFVFSENDPMDVVSAALTTAGMDPGRDEFKSGASVAIDPRQAVARDSLEKSIYGMRIALVVTPREERPNLGLHAIHALTKFVNANAELRGPLSMSFDEGVFSSRDHGRSVTDCEPALSNIAFRFDVDSREVMGVQIADLVAHGASTMLRESMGLITKTVKAGENSGYDPELDLAIGWSIWARFRYSFLHGPSVHAEEERFPSPIVNVSDFGLFVAPTCSEELRQNAEARFGTMYLGCIH